MDNDSSQWENRNDRFKSWKLVLSVILDREFDFLTLPHLVEVTCSGFTYSFDFDADTHIDTLKTSEMDLQG